jgi:hypothetical protein
MILGGQQIGHDIAIGLGALDDPHTSRYLLSVFNVPQFSLGLIVIEGNGKVCGKTQYLFMARIKTI